MLDAKEDARLSADEITCDLAIVGAGIAGLNALVVASQYMPRGARIALIDKRRDVGGMWTDTYDYVRLHQPHPMFTAGDVRWPWSKARSYLAARDEVQQHLRYCADSARETGVEVIELVGHQMRDIEEVRGSAGASARIRCVETETGASVTIAASRAINAVAMDIPQLQPLTFSSNAVISVSPVGLSARPDGDTPVVVVGGGKTGLDTILRLLQTHPGRPVILVNGKGTIFARRDVFLPTGVSRWTRGEMFMATFGDLAMRFDGTNQSHVLKYFERTYGTTLNGGDQCIFGLLSDEECATAKAGLSNILPGYLNDVVDGADGPELRLRDGTIHKLPEGSVVVNCTGHLLTEDVPPAKALSDGGAVLSITPRQSMHFLTSVSAYFLTHLWMRGELEQTPIYFIDSQALFRTDKQLWLAVCCTQAFLNALILFDHLPFRILDRCGLDFDRWYPLHRRLLALVDAMRHGARYKAHCIEVLDRVSTEHGTQIGPLSKTG